jgi:nucleoid DNA-binding protein
MTKAELIKKIKAKLQSSELTSFVPANGIGPVLAALGAVAAESLASGGEVPLPRIGKLKGKKRQGRIGRNPRTGTPIDIPAHMGVKFEAGKPLVDALKGAA